MLFFNIEYLPPPSRYRPGTRGGGGQLDRTLRRPTSKHIYMENGGGNLPSTAWGANFTESSIQGGGQIQIVGACKNLEKNLKIMNSTSFSLPYDRFALKGALGSPSWQLSPLAPLGKPNNQLSIHLPIFWDDNSVLAVPWIQPPPRHLKLQSSHLLTHPENKSCCPITK